MVLALKGLRTISRGSAQTHGLQCERGPGSGSERFLLGSSAHRDKEAILRRPFGDAASMSAVITVTAGGRQLHIGRVTRAGVNTVRF